MAKKIIQYCYFGQDSVLDNYNAYNFQSTSKKDRENEFKAIAQKGSLYVFDKIANVYLQLNEESQYDETQTYYTKLQDGKINYPITLTKASLISGSAFNGIAPIIKLGIQAIPGTRFRVNSNKDWIIIGATGIYELDLSSSSATIVKLQFDEVSLNIIDQNENAYLIIDLMSEQMEG